MIFIFNLEVAFLEANTFSPKIRNVLSNTIQEFYHQDFCSKRIVYCHLK